jgi:hypothetical protein
MMLEVGRMRMYGSRLRVLADWSSATYVMNRLIECSCGTGGYHGGG